MKKTKMSTRIFRMFIIICFAIFITIYISNKYGYYEYKKYEKVSLTQEEIKRFEEDIKEGKDVSLEKYLQNTNKNYQTNLSQAGLNVSNILSNTVKYGVDKFFNYIGKLIVESN